jgi:uncharacterized C2H2 Zn-finger protein
MAKLMAVIMQERSGHRMWCCPGCHKTLGEVIGTRLVVILRSERIVNFSLVDGLEMSCPKCGQLSALKADHQPVAA